MDVVITYVNGADKSWQASYAKHVKKPIEEARYRDWGTMPYLVRGIRKYMTYIDKIFIVVADASQVPAGVDLKDVRIVYHKDIIPEKYLPCFNSCVIEMFLYRIPELSEQFIYFNDDTFVLQPTEETDFFVNGKPVLAPKISKYNNFDTFPVFIQQCINSTDLIVKGFGLKSFPQMSYIMQEHRMRPFLKSSCEKVWNKCSDSILHSLTRVRHDRNLNAYIFNNYDYVMGNYVMKRIPYNVIYTANPLLNVCNSIEQPKSKFLCMNDNSPLNFYTGKDKICEAFNNNCKEIKKEIIKVESEPVIIKNANPKVALCCIAKKENLYIREWVEYYKNLGISKIFIYDNNDLDGEHFEEVINDYIQSGFVKIIDVRGTEKGLVYNEEGINLQTSCYIDCYENNVKNFDWVCFFDVDEFLSFRDTYDFNVLTKECFDNAYTVVVPWEHYDDNDLLKYENKPVVKRFTRKSKLSYHGVKSFVKTGLHLSNMTRENLIHCFIIDEERIYDINGNHIYTNKWNWITINPTSEQVAVLNHYKTKTIGEFFKRHFNRYWGTSTKHTGRQKNYYRCLLEFAKYNVLTVEKIDSLNTTAFKGIIALTSWKNRITYVHKTIQNLLSVTDKMFKIVLTLSEDEFPNKEKELPIELTSLLCNRFEILWIKKNYKVFKKVLFAMQKYYMLPIISADDDCIYKYDYATELYNKWKEHPLFVWTSLYENKWTVNTNVMHFSHGRATLFPPSVLLDELSLIDNEEILSTNNDDSFYGIYCFYNKVEIHYLNYKDDKIISFHDEINPLTSHLIGNQKNKFLEDKLIIDKYMKEYMKGKVVLKYIELK